MHTMTGLDEQSTYTIEYDGSDMNDLEGTIGGGLIIIGGVAVIAILLFCFYLRCWRTRRRDDDNDIEKGRTKKERGIRGNVRGYRWKGNQERNEEKNWIKPQREKTDREYWGPKDTTKKRKINDNDTDNSEAQKKARKEKEKKIEKKIEKKLQEKMDKKIDKIIDKKIDKKSDKKKKKRRNDSDSDSDSDSDISRGRRSFSYRTRSTRSSRRRSPRRRRHEHTRESTYNNRNQYYSERSIGMRPMPCDRMDSRNFRYCDGYVRNGSSRREDKGYPSIVTQTTAPESKGSWNTDFFGATAKPLKSTGGQALPMEISYHSCSSYSDSNIFPEETPSMDEDSSTDSLSKFLVRQLSIYRSMNATR